MKNLEVKKISIELMNVAEVACLSTLTEDGFPETRALLNLNNPKQFPKLTQIIKKSEENMVAYLTTNTSSFKMKNILDNPKVNIYYYKEGSNAGLMLQGTIEIVNDMKLKEAFWHDEWKIFFPKGIEDSDYTLLRLTPEIAKGYHQMKNFILNYTK